MRVSFDREGGVVTTTVVPVDGIFAAGEKASCDQFGRGLDQMVPVKHPGVLRSYSGCFHEGLGEWGVNRFLSTSSLRNWRMVTGYVRLPAGMRFAEFAENGTSGHWPFREMVDSLTLLSTQTRPGIPNAVRPGARYCVAPKSVNWRAAFGVVGMWSGLQ